MLTHEWVISIHASVSRSASELHWHDLLWWAKSWIQYMRASFCARLSGAVVWGLEKPWGVKWASLLTPFVWHLINTYWRHINKVVKVLLKGMVKILPYLDLYKVELVVSIWLNPPPPPQPTPPPPTHNDGNIYPSVPHAVPPLWLVTVACFMDYIRVAKIQHMRGRFDCKIKNYDCSYISGT